MDPNATLDLVRVSLASLAETARNNSDPELAGEVEELEDAFAALDAWLSRGGFLPRDWER